MSKNKQIAKAMEEDVRQPDILKNITLEFNGSSASVIQLQLFISANLTENQRKVLESYVNTFMSNVWQNLVGVS